MAWRLRTSVVRGEIDNRIKGTVTGRIWLAGRDEPVELKLEGNGSRDVAGSLFAFVNPDPQVAEEPTDLFSEQVGSIGDYTASRKVRAFEVPLDEALAMIRRGEKPPEHMANSLYLEWFSERNGRVVIESYDYEMKIVETAWLLDEQTEAEQLEKSAESMMGFMQQLGEAIEQSEDSLYDPENDKPMDEFEWERFMKKADARTEQYGKLLEKYMDHPDRDQIVAHEMGWDDLANDLEAYDEAVEEGAVEPFDFNEEDFEEPVPNPLTEGINWVRDEYGHPVHPLQQQAAKTVMTLWHECKEARLLDGDAFSHEIHGMLFNGQCIGAKLAGALNHLGFDSSPDNGFIIACLKRALPYFDEMMKAFDKAAEKNLLPGERLDKFSSDMFAVRAEIVQLMERFRNGFDG